MSINLLPFLANESELLLNSKSRSKVVTLHFLEVTGGKRLAVVFLNTLGCL